MAPSEATSALVFDSAVLVAVSGGLFLLCRRFLQATLSPALRRVSKPGQDALVPLLGSAQDDDEGTSSLPIIPKHSLGSADRACAYSRLSDSSTPFGSPVLTGRNSPRILPNGLPFSTTSRDAYARQPSDLNLPGQVSQPSSSPSPSGSTRRTPSGGGGGELDRAAKSIIHVHQTPEESARSVRGTESDAERKKNLYGKAARSVCICPTLDGR